MLTERDLAAYIQRVRGQLIDVDGVFGAQCWDQWSHYATNFLGVPSWPTYTNAGGTGPHAGWACNVWHHFNSSGLAQWFDMVPAGQPLRAGDVPIWESGTVWYPYSHIATLLEVRPNGMLRCLTQNPGAAQIADLIPRGMLGALRPKALTVGDFTASKTPTLTKSEKENLMANANAYIATMKNGKQINAIFNTQSGFFHTFESENGEYNTNILRTFGVPWPSSMVSESHFDAVERDCAAVRTSTAR